MGFSPAPSTPLPPSSLPPAPSWSFPLPGAQGLALPPGASLLPPADLLTSASPLGMVLALQGTCRLRGLLWLQGDWNRLQTKKSPPLWQVGAISGPCSPLGPLALGQAGEVLGPGREGARVLTSDFPGEGEGPFWSWGAGPSNLKPLPPTPWGPGLLQERKGPSVPVSISSVPTPAQLQLRGSERERLPGPTAWSPWTLGAGEG